MSKFYLNLIDGLSDIQETKNSIVWNLNGDSQRYDEEEIGFCL